MPAAFDVSKLRARFPILKREVHGNPLIYFDNAATTQKPDSVIETIDRYYRAHNANVHRGAHTLSQEATSAYEGVREKVAKFINAGETREIIFTRGTTESINLVAASYGREFLKPGDEIVLSAMEHHSNIVPWQMICEQTGARLRIIPMNDAGELLMDQFEHLLNDRTKIVSVVHVSNSLGTINPIARIIEKTHAHGAVVMVDGAQWVAHGPLDVRALDVDFYAFSGHKLYGPTGIGVLYGKADLLDKMPPYQGGGDMIRSVSFEKTVYNVLPHKFEAGTPNIADGIGLGAAIDFVTSIGHANIARHERHLLEHAIKKLSDIPGLRLIGTAHEKAGVISFIAEHPPLSTLDLGIRLDARGIAVRTGHHCCEPVMQRLNIPATARASLAVYNTTAEVDALAAALREIFEAELAQPVHPAPAQPVFPNPSAKSPQAAADELIEIFDALGDWTQRHQFLIDDLGKKLSPLPDAVKTEANRVHGCMSRVHLVSRPRPGTPDGLDFAAQSDAFIVNGLIALLEKLFAGQPAGAILSFDVGDLLKKLGLDQHLSLGRRNGLSSMIERIRSEAGKIARKHPAAV